MNTTVGTLNPETSRLYRIRKTCLKMLSKRGYIVPDEHLKMTPEEFQGRFGDAPSREDLSILVEKTDDPGDQLFVFFPVDEKVSSPCLHNYHFYILCKLNKFPHLLYLTTRSV